MQKNNANIKFKPAAPEHYDGEKHKHYMNDEVQFPNMKVYCIYHRIDWDGVASAAIVKKFIPQAILIPFNYGDKSPIEKINPKSAVFVVDVSLEDEDMLLLNNKCKVLWCDHHKTALNKQHLKHIKGKRGLGASGCLLTFELFKGFSVIPEPIRLLSDYDIWNQSDMKHWNERVLPFQMGMRKYPLDPDNPWLQDFLLKDDKAWINKTIEEGKAILLYEDERVAKYMDEHSYEGFIEHKGKRIRVLAVNVQGVNSNFFKSKFDKVKHDIMVAFSFNGEVFKYSMYSPKGGVDVGEIAFANNGGGHKHAAGFRSTCHVIKPQENQGKISM